MSPSPPPSVTEELASRLAAPVDAAARQTARLHLLDWLGCVAGARNSEMGAIARRAHDDRLRRAHDDRLRRAALLGSVLEMDDVDRLGRVHPGPVVWAAAMLQARLSNPAMAALLDAGVRGTEATVAIARMLDDRHYGFFHPTHTAGRFGAAAAAASLAGLSMPQTVAALGIAGSSAGAVWQVRHEAATSKAFHVADAVLGGLFAADLAGAGMTGPRLVLEGPQGIFAAMGGAVGAIVLDRWLIADVSFKPWAACRHAHPAIDAALALPPGALASGPIRLETYGDALTFCDRPDPQTTVEAKFSLQHSIAVVAVRGRPSFADFEPAALADPALAAARARVVLAENSTFTAAYPAHFGASVTAGGAQAAVDDALGDPENPIDLPALLDKFRALVAWGGLSASEAEAAIALVLHSADEAAAAPLLALVERWLA